MRRLILALAAAASPAWGQGAVQPSAADVASAVSAANSANQQAQAAFSKAAAAISATDANQLIATATAGLATKASVPTPATMTPPAEGAGSAGTMTGIYALANHTHPRVTDSLIVYTVAGGAFTATPTPGKFTKPPVVSLSWVNTTGAFMNCEMSASPTISLVTGRCRAFSLTGLLTLGAGIEVHILILPNTGV